MMNINTMIRSFLLIILMITVTGCATKQTTLDPLQNTKKLIAEGHVSLYRNGAFQVPNTSISLIPPGPSTLEFVKELMGIRAKQSFLLSLEHAADSVYIVSEGTSLTFDLAKNIQGVSGTSADEIKKYTRENSRLLVYRSSDLGKSIVGKSWALSKRLYEEKAQVKDDIVASSKSTGNAISEQGTEQGTGLAGKSQKAAGAISSAGLARSGSDLAFAGRTFVKGYMTVPTKIKKRVNEMGDDLSDAKLFNIFKEENETRKRWSLKTVDLISNTAKNYTENVFNSFNKAGKELDGSYRTTGLSLAALKSLRWVLQGILWDATIEPLANVSTASIGYIGVNFLAFPSLVTIREGVATTKLAVEVSWDATKMSYDLIAPTGVAALAGVFGVLDFTGSQAIAGATAAVGSGTGYAEAGLSRAAGVVVKGTGYGAGKGVEYIGIPLASAGIALGGGTIGTAVGGSGAATGGTLFIAGEAGSMATQVFGNMIAGTTLVGGTAASTAGGAAYGVYEVSKAVAVPAGYELGGGVVLSYETLSHVGAHAILAVADCSYMVLSLEGPRWVLYAIRGNIETGDDLPAGSLLDLKKMQASGEDIYNVPLSDDEMKAVVSSVYETLPEMKTDTRNMTSTAGKERQ